jgi:cephalosporin hydroxylase
LTNRERGLVLGSFNHRCDDVINPQQLAAKWLMLGTYLVVAVERIWSEVPPAAPLWANEPNRPFWIEASW